MADVVDIRPELSYKRSLKFQAPLSERECNMPKEILRLGYVR